MKKIQLNKGLNLNKETVTKLQESQLSNFKGGVAGVTCGNASCANSCNEGSCNKTKVAQLQ
ncbi:class I lanthipeptide [Flavobacterium jumunjinense]|uniref:Class I lanthipeptide n=1 Tax=Flavobacterium jumunjinense TaxID=998845 RepID=A0ABV5GR60_9FLAO|nr:MULTISPECIES: class I lanthipeptide [Flavobacterium]